MILFLLVHFLLGLVAGAMILGFIDWMIRRVVSRSVVKELDDDFLKSLNVDILNGSMVFDKPLKKAICREYSRRFLK